jgi:hypothetical protein
VLVQQGDRVDQGQVLLVVPPGPGPAVQEAQRGREGIHHRQRRQQPLGVLVKLHE